MDPIQDALSQADTDYEIVAPRSLPLDELGHEGLTNLITTGIVNPMGPTLNVLALDGSPEPGATMAVVHVMLHPFLPQANQVGVARIGAAGSIDGYRVFFRRLQEHAGCPTLLLSNSMFALDASVESVADLLAGFDNGSATLARIQRFQGDPWGRVTDEMEAADVLPDSEADRQMTRDEAREFAGMQLREENVKVELEAFMFAWNGSIGFQSDVGSDLAKTAIPLESLVQYLALLAPTTRIPGVEISHD